MSTNVDTNQEISEFITKHWDYYNDEDIKCCFHCQPRLVKELPDDDITFTKQLIKRIKARRLQMIDKERMIIYPASGFYLDDAKGESGETIGSAKSITVFHER
jgi:hypothetical protein